MILEYMKCQESGSPAVAVDKRVNKLELVMKICGKVNDLFIGMFFLHEFIIIIQKSL